MRTALGYARTQWSTSIQRGLRWLIIAGSGIVSAVVLVTIWATVTGQDVFVITGGSMSPTVPPGSLVVAERVHLDRVQPGDIITFRRTSAPDAPVTHRVTTVDRTSGGVQVWTKGDANLTVDPEPIVGDHLVSRTRVTLPMAGYLMTLMRTTFGQVLFVGLPLAYLAIRGLRGGRSPGSPMTPPIDAAKPVKPREAPRRRSLDVSQHVRPSAGLRNVTAGARPRLLRALTRTLIRPAAWAANVRAKMPVARSEPPVPPRLARIDSLFHSEPAVPSTVVDKVLVAVHTVQAITNDLKARESEFEIAMDRSLAPLVDYADRLEEGLKALEARLDATDAALRHIFDAQIRTERARLLAVRAAIEDAKQPLRAMLVDESRALDAIMAPFDAEVASVEQLQQAQQRHLVRVAAGLDSEEFRAAAGFVAQRMQRLEILAEMGETNPSEVRSTLAADASHAHGGNVYISSALAALESLASDPDEDPTQEVPLSSAA